MQGDNIVSLLHGITFIYPTQTASSKFTLHHSKNNCETSRMRTLHSPPFYPANLWQGHQKNYNNLSQ